MSVKIGNTDIDKIFLGATEIGKVYLGTTLVYEKTSAVVNLYNEASKAHPSPSGGTGSFTTDSNGGLLAGADYIEAATFLKLIWPVTTGTAYTVVLDFVADDLYGGVRIKNLDYNFQNIDTGGVWKTLTFSGTATTSQIEIQIYGNASYNYCRTKNLYITEN